VRSETERPTGLARRGRRLSDRETEQRMLRTAVAMVRRDGLTVSLDSISLEDVIRDADVSRSAVYRRWPYKDLFISDLVKELAKNATPEIVKDELELIRRIVTEHQDRLGTPELRRALIVELLRQLALFDFETMYRSAGWRTYIALHATVMSLTEGTLRDQVRDALAESERIHNARVAQAWRHMTALLGYRLRPGSGVTFETLATMLGATLRGLIVMALSAPEVVGYRVQARPFDADAEREWSLPALGLGGIAEAFLEPDPEAEWDDARLAGIHEALRTWVPDDPSPPG
jgi:AcrR family transcriptional regulator